MKNHIQYLYSTETLKRAIERKDKTKSWNPRAKAGETGQENASIRVAQQDGTSAFERLEILGEKKVPPWITDGMVRDALFAKGYAKARVDADREWIEFVGLENEDQMLSTWLEVLNELEHGKTGIVDFEPDQYQTDFAIWAHERWDAGAEELLNGSKMRSGKCMMSHLTTLKNDFKKVLVLTGKPGALRGWGELLVGGGKSHVKFSDNNFFHYKDQKDNPIKFTSQRNTVAVGLQWIHTHTKKGNNPLLDQILNTEWDSVYIDECHSAKDTKLAQEFLFKLKIKKNRVLNLSGTPFKVLMSNDIQPKDQWSWDYIKEQKFRKWLLQNEPGSERALRFKYLPKLTYAMMHVPAKVKALLNGEVFNLGANGLWAIDKDSKQLKFPESVSEMVNFIRSQGYKNVPDTFKPCVDLHTRHSFWLLPDNVEAIKRLRDILERHPYFKKFQILVASGNEVKDDVTVEDAVKRIEQGLSEYKGTITLSCGRLVEGTTIPQWCSVHQLNSDKSVTAYFQSGFRAGSPCPEFDKQEVCVYDYDPERFLQMVYELAIDYCDRENGQSPSDWIETEWNEVSDVYDFDNEWNILSGKEIVQKATQDVAGIPNMFHDISLVDPKCITQDHVNEMNGAEYSNSQSGSSNLNSNGLETGSVSTTTRSSSSVPPEKTRDDITVTRLQISEAVKKIPNLIFISYDYAFKITSVYDIIKCHEIGIVKEQTGLTTSQWNVIINAINVDKLNRRIDAYVNSQ
jgi:hypothetical protein